jgi:hypothetical protein
MAVVVRMEDLTGFRGPAPPTDEDMVVPLSDDPAALAKLWGLVLLLAIRDGATSIHYHPWRADGGLAYVVANVRYAMVPPPADLAEPMVAVARSVFAGGGRSGPACSTMEVDVWGNVYLWDAVVWSSAARAGVDLFRIAPAVPEPPNEPGAAPDRPGG